MKIYLKKRILNAILSIEECHEYISKLDNIEHLIEYLSLCQSVAISIGENLESQENDREISDEIVSILEEYCDNVFELSNVDEIDSGDFVHLLNICIQKISNIKAKISNEISEEKSVVVFLPYIASMWDSLDSICREAMKSEMWDTYVFPTPYFSLDAKRQISAEHFEYDEFPADLPLIDYRKKSLEDLKPDLIFYHNPYDGNNLVTQVYPQFFTENLKKITPYLVYVPYYISGGKTASHFPEMPGVKNAWRVVVQDGVKEQYLEIYSDEKILPLGSPKLDALVNIDAKDIPEHWRKKIADKTVLLLNTHLTSAMIAPAELIDMMDYIMDFMQANKDITILWRPHPLIQQTLSAFQENPQFIEQYKKRVDKFSALDNGIYDDTPDLHRSLAISDAYIGSAKSSVLKLYSESNKPFYLIPDAFKRNWWNSNCFKANRGGVVLDGHIWQFCHTYNALFKFNLKTQKITYVTSFSKYAIDERHLFYAANKYNDWLILLPYQKKEIALFNTKTNEIKYIEIEAEDFKEVSIISSDVKNDILTVVVNETSDYYYNISLKDFSCKKNHIKPKGKFYGVCSGNVFIHNEGTNTLILIDVIDCLEKTFTLPNDFIYHRSPFIKIIDNSLYIMRRNDGILLICDDITNKSEFKAYNLYSECKTNKDCSIRTCHIGKNKILFSTTNSDALYSCDINKLSSNLLISKTVSILAPYALDTVEADGSVYVLPFIMANPYILKLNLEHTNAEKIDCLVDNSDKLQQTISESIDNYKKKLDYKLLPLNFKDWLKCVDLKSSNQKEIDNRQHSNIGAKIWEHISIEF